jgi:hypothetical protein
LKPLLFALACVLPVCAAQADTLGFKGVAIGSPLSRIASDPRYACNAVNTPSGDTICSLRPREVETIAGAPIASLFYFYDVGSLTGIQISIAEKDFSRVVDALTAKYGPGKVSAAKVKNLNGKEFEDRAYSWQRPDGSVRAQRYDGRLDLSVIRYGDDQAIKRVQQRRSAARDPKQDL